MFGHEQRLRKPHQHAFETLQRVGAGKRHVDIDGIDRAGGVAIGDHRVGKLGLILIFGDGTGDLHDLAQTHRIAGAVIDEDRIRSGWVAVGIRGQVLQVEAL